MSLFEIDDTLTVGQVTRQLSEAIKRTFRSEVWIQGQIRNLSRSARGHVYFDLIDPMPAGATPKASLPVTLFDSNRQVVNRIITRTGNNVRIDDGVEVRIRGTVELYAPRGQVQLNMTSIDPEFTLGRLGADREQLLRDLQAADLLEANRRVPMPMVPLRVALITSDGSAAHADFTQQLATSGYTFAVTTLATRVQGEFASEEIAQAIDHAQTLDIDVIAVVRGGGARTDLAAFDTEPVARSIAGSTHPVLSGVGHEIDQSVADLVAFAAFKTPTACAQYLIERVIEFDFALRERAQRVATLAIAAPNRHQHRLDTAAVAVGDRARTSLTRATDRNNHAAAGLERRVARRILRANERLAELHARTRIGSATALSDAYRRCAEHAEQLQARPPRQLKSAGHRLDLIAARVSAVDPALAMRRGWSFTTTTDGVLVRTIDDAPAGTELITRVLNGTVTSTVSATTPRARPPLSDQEST